MKHHTLKTEKIDVNLMGAQSAPQPCSHSRKEQTSLECMLKFFKSKYHIKTVQTLIQIKEFLLC